MTHIDITVPEKFQDEEGKTHIIPAANDSGGHDGTLDSGDTRFKFKRLSEYKPGEAWIMMYYGPSKAGKTHFAGTAGPRTLFLNIGDGLETLLSPGFTRNYPNAKDMIVVDIRELQPNNVADAFDMLCDALDHALANFIDKFDTVVLDEATALRKYALTKAIELNAAQATKQVRKDRNRYESYTKAEVGDYGIEMDMIEWFLGKYIPIFKEAKKNFIMLAHERQVYQRPKEIGGEATLKRVLPGFTGKTFPDKVPAFFDDVWKAEVIGGDNNAVYRARTAGNEIELGGSRHNGTFMTVEPNPNFLKMLERIRSSKSVR